MWRLQAALGEIAGLPHVSLQPSAGSHGELAGVLLTRAYHEDRGERRTKVLTPDTAHGTNPATVTMAGYEVVKVGTDDHGNVDLDDLRAKADRGRRLPDADQPLDARAVRARDRGDRRGSSTASARRCTTTAPTSTRSWASAGPATWASTSCTSTCTSRSPSRTAAAVRAPARSPSRTGSSRSCRGRRWCAAGRRRTDRRRTRVSTTSTTTGPSRSAGCAASRATTACSCAPTPTSARSARPGLREVSEVAVLNANYLLARLRQEGVLEYLPVGLRPSLHARVRALGRADEARAAGSGRSIWPSGCSTTACTRRPSTSRCWSTRRC